MKDSGSPVRAYLERVSPRLEASAGSTGGARIAAGELGLPALVDAYVVIPRAAGVDGTLSGTAFDFRARIELGDFNPRESAAAAGIARAAEYASWVENGHHRVAVLAESFDVAQALLRHPANDTDLDRASVLLAHCERVLRSGARALSGGTGKLLDNASDGSSFADQISPMMVADIGSLVEASRMQLEEWRGEIVEGTDFASNPGFAGSELVGGADADWIIGDTLIDCKVYNRLSVSELRGFLLQLLGYVMLDLDDRFGIRQVGIWLPRQGLMPMWSLTRLLSGDPELLLPSLREGFVRATGNQQIALKEPVPERHRHQILAENRHTPFEMLNKLALNEDPRIRSRVGRNTVTPEETVRALAGDRAWSVRKGVAINEAAPGDVLLTLARDKSVAVRRAVAANPSTQHEVIKALASDPDVSVRWTARSNDGAVVLLSQPGAPPSGVPAQAATIMRIDPAPVSPASDVTWLCNFIMMVNGASQMGGTRLPVPDASWRWGMLAKRRLDVPAWLRAGLPDDIASDLMGNDRPEKLRRAAAWQRPIDDHGIRDALLQDPDPAIRWRAFCRTVHQVDARLAPLLTELGTSRDARLRFRTHGSSDYKYMDRQDRARYNDEVLQVLASHRSTPPDVLAHLLASPSPAIRAQLVANPTLSTEDRNILIEKMFKSRDAGSRVFLTELDDLPLDVLVRLAADNDFDVRRAVAGHERLPQSTMVALAADPGWEVRLEVLQNPSRPTELIADTAASVLRDAPDWRLPGVLAAVIDLASSEVPKGTIEEALVRLSKSRLRDPDVRQAAASHQRTPPAVLARLARVADSGIRAAVAANPRTPADALEALSTDPDEYVRTRVSGNESTPPAAIIALSHDASPKARQGIAARVSLAPDVLERLLNDESQEVREIALANPGAREVFHRWGESFDDAVAEFNQQQAPTPTNRALLLEMAANSRAQVRLLVAFDPNADADILSFLGGERRSTHVRRAVAANPHSPANLLASLAEDSDELVLQAVAFNGATPAGVLLDLAARSVDLALLVALNPDTPDEVLDVLTNDAEPLVRFVANGMSTRRLASISAGTSRASLPTVGHPHSCQ
ncbi:hypothetical protein [Pseudarthrobacter sp. GA104]|uniref:hypothetical protein n=1 Tax=Pseudarthrobacter sp. GA104 TaxID=2676311 RepID=UPI0012FBC5A3|nr:hypothetical protein [Pseudarthrobacter sp. GA104]MUU73524.1 hypothetical protein [Pseudarthrobacter sp. GA104]